MFHRFTGSAFRLCTALGVLALAGLFPVATGHAQDAEEDSLAYGKNPYGSGMGLEVVLTNSGFGLGGYFHRALSPSTSLMAEVLLAPGKDEREFKFTSYFRTSIPNKANYLIMMPVQMGLFKRLFREHIEDNFRPYLQVTGGPTLGWAYPYFRDCNGNGLFDSDTAVGDCRERAYDPIGAIPRGHFQLGMGGNFALGAHFGSGKKMTQGVRIGYGFSYFFDEVQLLEPDVEGGRQRYFGSPSISLTFGRLF